MSVINDILDGWEQARDRRTPEGFAKNMSLLFDDLKGQEVMAETLARRNGEEYISDPVADWDRKIEAMMTSNDPRIQKAGLDLLDDQMRMDTSQIRNQEPNSYREYKMATPMEEQSPGGYNDWLMNRQTQRVMNVQDPNAPVPLNELSRMQDAQGNPLMFPVGTTWDEVKNAGANVGGTRMTGEEARRADQFGLARDNLSELRDVMGSGADLSGISGQVKAARSEGGWTGAALDTVMNAFGVDNMTPQDVTALGLVSSIENTVVAAIRGAAVGPKEIDQFARQLPRAGMPMEQFMRNLELTERNLAVMEARRNLSRGLGETVESDMSESEIRNMIYQSMDTQDSETESNPLDTIPPISPLAPLGTNMPPEGVDFGGDL